jgi:hypothetical protein
LLRLWRLIEEHDVFCLYDHPKPQYSHKNVWHILNL